MTDKSLVTIVGEDQDPIQDLTDYVNWDASRFMSMAYNGQSSVSSIVFRDEDSEMGPWIDTPITIAARNEVEVKLGSALIWRGRLIGRTWERGIQKANEARVVTAEAEDVNIELRGIIVDQWERPSETDVARVQALGADYLDGSPRVGTVIDVSTYVPNTNTVILPAKTYTQTDPYGVLSDIAILSDKMFFVTLDKELFYDEYIGSAYATSLFISEDYGELQADTDNGLAIIPDSGPLFAINGQRFASALRVYYGAGATDFVDGSDPGMEAVKAHWGEVVYAPDTITNATEANLLLNQLLTERSQDGRTFTLSVRNADGGPLTEAQVLELRPGKLITIKSHVLPLATYSEYTTRIVTVQWHMPLPNYYYATLKLERPEKLYGVGVKPGPQPAGPGSPPTFILSDSNAEGATGLSTLVVPSGLTDAALFIAVGNVMPQTFPPGVTWNGATGVLYGSFNHVTQGGIALYYILDPPPGGAWLDSGNSNGYLGAWLYEGVNQTTPIASWATATGTSAAAAASMTAVSGAMPIAAMTVDDDDFVNDGSGTGPVAVSGMTADWTYSLQAGTPGFRDMQYAGGHDDWSAGWTLDQSHPWSAFVAAVNGTGGSTTEPVGDAGDVGTDSGTYANADHTHAHGQLSEPSDAHDAIDISVTPFGTIAATNVQDALVEVVAEATSGAPTTADYLVGTAQGGLSAEIVVGTTPGGELGNTWASPTVDATHAGSNHLQPVRKNSAGTVFERRRLNLIEGSNVTLTVADDAGDDEVDITIASSGGGGSLTVEDEGTPLATAATTLDFVGAGVTATGAGAEKTITIPGGGAGVTVQDEGTPLATDGTTLNFVGAGVTATGAGATKTITIPGGGGTASPFWWHSDNAPGSPDAANREFTEGTVVGTLTRVAHGTPKGTWTEEYDGLQWAQTASGLTDLDVYAIARTINVGDYVTIAFEWTNVLGSNPTLGAFVGFANGTTFGTSNAIGVSQHGAGGQYRFMLNSWPGFNTRTNDGTILDHGITGLTYGVRVKYEAANTWGLYILHPGGVWRTVQTNHAYTMTPTHVIFGVDMLNSPALVSGAGIRLECFRVND
jgi:hypothetical protein